MSTYTKSTDFLAKDSLPLNNAAKYVKGSEIDTEFDAIETADADNMKKSAMGTGVETFLGTPSSANLAAAVTGETGTGALVFATSPTLVTPALGTPASGTLTNCTGLPQAGTTGLTTADSPQFTAVNLGHASDTTLTRVSAGVVAVEGVNLVKADACSIASGKVLTVSNTMTLTGTDSTSYNMDSATSTTLKAIVTTSSGTEAAFTSIPSSAKKIVISLTEVSTAGAVDFDLSLGDSGGYEVTNYYGGYSFMENGVSPVVATYSAGSTFQITYGSAATDSWSGAIVLEKHASDFWVMSGVLYNRANGMIVLSGYNELTTALDRVKISVASSSFDNGAVALSYTS